MQVSVYLSEALVQKVDRLAKREGRSRSKVIEALLEASLGSGSGNRIAALAGAWKDTRSAEEIIAEICRDRRRNRRSERPSL